MSDTAQTVNKQGALIASITESVSNAVISVVESKIDPSLASINASMTALHARLVCLESIITNGAAAKRKICVATKKDADKGDSSKASVGVESSKITNSMLFTRKAFSENLLDFRKIYCNESTIKAAEKDPGLSKHSESKNPSSYWSAVGAFVWKSILTSEQKIEIRTLFTSWKENSARNEIAPPLEEDQDVNPEDEMLEED